MDAASIFTLSFMYNHSHLNHTSNLLFDCRVYEALQLYTSKASRKSSVGDYDGAIKIASEGACVFICDIWRQRNLITDLWISKRSDTH